LFLKWALQPANRRQSGAAPDDPLLAYALTDYAAFATYLNEGRASGTDPDPPMRERIAQQLGWFLTLREYHD
jgi:hypothetical protein